jgi:hypothetical protein
MAGYPAVELDNGSCHRPTGGRRIGPELAPGEEPEKWWWIAFINEDGDE